MFKRREDTATDEQVEALYDNFTQPDVAFDVQLLYEALDKLPLEQREAVIMAEITGLSHKEIQGSKRNYLGCKGTDFQSETPLSAVIGC